MVNYELRMNKDFSKLHCELTTNRLLLRPVEILDAEKIWPYVSEPGFPKYMSWEAHKDIGETRKFCKNCVQNFTKGKGITWSIFLRETEEFCGVIGLDGVIWNINAFQTGGRAEMGYWIGEKFWGQEIVLEAARSVLQFAFHKIGFRKVTVSHITENHQSQRVIEKLKFRYIGEQKDECFKNNAWYDDKVYEMLEREFQ